MDTEQEALQAIEVRSALSRHECFLLPRSGIVPASRDVGPFVRRGRSAKEASQFDYAFVDHAPIRLADRFLRAPIHQLSETVPPAGRLRSELLNDHADERVGTDPPKGIEQVGPRAFGYDLDFRSVFA